jgi:hypothetical protein
MDRRIPVRRERWDALALRQLIGDLEEARLLAVQAERTELAESLGAWMERLEQANAGGSRIPTLVSESSNSELWLG